MYIWINEVDKQSETRTFFGIPERHEDNWSRRSIQWESEQNIQNSRKYA